MYFGVSLSAMAQQPADADMTRRFREILEYVRHARELGFDFLYQGQHYLSWPYQQLQNMSLLARVAAEAEGMGIAATAVIPLHHPVDLAERVATMDVITGGRFVLAAALGYREEEYAAFGVDRRRRVPRYLECLEVMQRLWTQEEVDFQGEHFRLAGARMALKPVQKPHPPIWVAANSDAAVRRAARLGYTWYVNPHATRATMARQIDLYRRSAREAGTRAPEALPIGREVFVHADRETALREARPYLGGKYETYARWGQDRALPADDSFHSAFQDLARDRFIIGGPEECVAELERYRVLGMSHALLRMVWPEMSLNDGLANMERFARDVLPHFRREAGAPEGRS